MRKKLQIIGLLLSLSCFVKAQQDAQFSQYMFNGIYINPAYAGYKEELNVHAFYRNQWTGINGSPKTMSLAIDAIANNGNVGLALQVSRDRVGAQSNDAVYANYAYRIPMNMDGSARLAFGIGVGVVQLGINGAVLEPNDPEVHQPTTMQSTIIPDARVGVYYANDRFYAGISADNLISQYSKTESYTFIPQPKPHYYLTSGLLIPLDQDILLKPSILLKDDRGGLTALDLNAFVILVNKFWIGTSYRTGVKLYSKDYLQKDLSKLNSIVAALQFFPSENIRIGYAYDYHIGALESYNGGTHEISLGYSFKRKNIRMVTPRYF